MPRRRNTPSAASEEPNTAETAAADEVSVASVRVTGSRPIAVAPARRPRGGSARASAAAAPATDEPAADAESSGSPPTTAAAARAAGKPLTLSQYIAILRREVARAGVLTEPEEDLPLVTIAEVELSMSYVAVDVEDDSLLIDPSRRTLSEAPEAAIQRMRLRITDVDVAMALREQG